MVDLLSPNFKDIKGIYETEFAQMAQVDVPLKELEGTRERLVKEIMGKITDDERKFLLSFKSMKPEWKLLGMQNLEQIANLPSVRWKMKNLQAMPEKKHSEALLKLEKVLTQK